MDVEDAYRLIDLYAQEVEKCGSVESVYQQQFNMIMDFTERVRQAKLPENMSREVFAAILAFSVPVHFKKIIKPLDKLNRTRYNKLENIARDIFRR